MTEAIDFHALREAIIREVAAADRNGTSRTSIAYGVDRAFASVGAALARSESPSPEALTEALRPWLRHKDWCNVKTDDPPDTERCKCGLRAALVR